MRVVFLFLFLSVVVSALPLPDIGSGSSGSGDVGDVGDVAKKVAIEQPSEKTVVIKVTEPEKTESSTLTTTLTTTGKSTETSTTYVKETPEKETPTTKKRQKYPMHWKWNSKTKDKS